MVTTEKKNIGYLRQIIGPVVDVEFPTGELPKIYNALKVEGQNTIGHRIRYLRSAAVVRR